MSKKKKKKLFLITFVVSIDVDQTYARHATDSWSGQYAAAYIEELTRKTGSHKSFAVFVSMLIAGLFTTSCITSRNALSPHSHRP